MPKPHVDRLEIDFEIPRYLESDIENYIRAINEQSTDWDCWWGEVYGSINMAFSSGAITEEQGKMLRDHYLYDKG